MRKWRWRLERSPDIKEERREWSRVRAGEGVRLYLSALCFGITSVIDALLSSASLLYCSSAGWADNSIPVL